MSAIAADLGVPPGSGTGPQRGSGMGGARSGMGAQSGGGLSTRRLAFSRATVALAALMVVVSLVGLTLNMIAPAHFTSRGGEFEFLCEPVVLCTVGGYLIHRRPDQLLSYLMLLAGLGAGLDSPAKAILNLPVGSHTSAVREWAAEVDNSTWILSFVAVVLVVLSYPDGRRPTRRWRWVWRAAILLGVVIFAGSALAPKSVDYPDVHTPVPTPLSNDQVNGAFGVLFGSFVVVFVLAVISLFRRGRRARKAGDVLVAAQIRWLAWAAAITIVGSALEGPITALTKGFVDNLGNIVSELAPFSLVVALAVSVTRHGLFEIDRVVSRTLTYILLTGVLLGLYLAIVAGLTELLPAHTGSVSVAAATLAIVAAFVPLQRGVRSRVDRRFNRQRHDRAALIEAFAEQLRRDVTHGSNGADLLAVVHRALEPTHAGVWLVNS